MEEMLHFAKEDFDIALLLYNEKEYSNALYHYNQCVEKTVNYIGLSTGSISEDQLKDISHKPIKVFSYLFDHIRKQSNGLMPPVDPRIFDEARKIIELKSEDQIVIECISILKLIANEKDVINEMLYPSRLEALRDYISKNLPEIDLGLDDEKYKDELAIYFDKKVQSFILFINCSIKILRILFINSLICSKFIPDSFRYTTESIGSPIEYFNKNNAFIKGLPYLMKTMNIPIQFSAELDWKSNSLRLK